MNTGPPHRPTEGTTPVISDPRLPWAAVQTVAPPPDVRPARASTGTEQLLRQRDALPAGHSDRVRIRARAIEANLPTAHRLARRYTGRGEPFDDLAQVAAVALVNAVDGYDPDRRTAFVSYAVPTILGALKRHFRDTTWGMRVPRAMQELTGEVRTASGELSQQRGRTPTPAELADHLHITVDQLRAALGAEQVYRLTSLNAPSAVETGDEPIDLLGGVDPHYARVDDRLTLRLLLATVPVRERRILAMRFYDNMTQTQIAAEIGVSQMQVSRLLNRTLTRLRATPIALAGLGDK
ncbi:SigB/SigF/SigG family RNA polymerase sigma factor [Plantactinospora sp. CA-294935]|uniref:SigB/SigF/SigG family RNA polymerase sigma factor n=1 Tax=Plantactinospora sp. CA-294935 TaxID=3240012 RepID=UPI003D8C9758